MVHLIKKNIPSAAILLETPPGLFLRSRTRVVTRVRRKKGRRRRTVTSSRLSYRVNNYTEVAEHRSSVWLIGKISLASTSLAFREVQMRFLIGWRRTAFTRSRSLQFERLLRTGHTAGACCSIPTILHLTAILTDNIDLQIRRLASLSKDALMLFSSGLFFFLVIGFLSFIYYWGRIRWRIIYVTAFSLYFYYKSRTLFCPAVGHGHFGLLHRTHDEQDRGRSCNKKLWVTLSLLVNLRMLSYFNAF